MQFGKLYIALSGARNNSSFANRDSLRLYKEVELADGETFKTKVTPWNPKLQHNADATIRYRFSDSTKLTYQYRHFNERLSSYGEVRRPQFRPYAFDEFYSTYRKDHSLNFESYLGKFLYLNTTTAYNQFDRYKETQRWDMESDTSELVDGGQDTTGFSSMLHRSILSSVFTKALNGQIGIEFLSETGTGERIIDTTSLPINETMIRNYAIWGSLKYDFNQMVIKANLRYGYNTKYNHPLIPSVHFNWKINKELKLQMSYAQGFRAPSLKELYFNFVDINHFIIGNENLKAERSQNTSLGINYEKAISKNRYSLSGKLFYNKIKDRIIIAEFEPFKFNYQNLEKFETHGFNIEAKYEFNKIFSLQSAIAYTRLFNLWSNDFDADKFTGLYEMQNRISFSIPKINAGIVLSHRFIGRQTRFYQDDENVLRQGFIGDYHQINATLNYGFWKERIFIAGGVKNLTNVKSVSFLGEGEGHSNIGNSQLVNWGRTFFVRMSLTI
jgi:outer membrane receptor for ferrienterochelin and colicins